MSEHPIKLEVRGADSFDSAADRVDPRTPEQRARQYREHLGEDAWQQLPVAAAASFALFTLVLAARPCAGCGSVPVVLLGVAGLLALVPLAPLSVRNPSWRWRVMMAEAAAAAAGMALLLAQASWESVLVAAIALVLSPGARAGTAAWAHLLVLGGATMYVGATLGAWAAAAMLAVVTLTAARHARHARQALQRARAATELSELNALCAMLASNVEGDAGRDQGTP